MADGPGVPALTHPVRWPVYSAVAQARCAELLAAGRSFDYGHGPEIAALEEDFARRHDRAFALAVNSGTSALFLAYQALGIGTGDEVIVADFTFLATATPLFWLGATPVLADSGDDSGCVTADSVSRVLSPRTRAVAVTHLFGHPCDMAPIRALCDAHGLALVEDCSHAHGSTDAGRSVGTWGDAAVYSIGGLKMVSGGMGGVLLTDIERVHDLACLAAGFQRRCELTVRSPRLRELSDVGLGGNLRITPLAAVLALSHLVELETLVERKRVATEQLRQELIKLPGLGLPHQRPGVTLGARYGVNLVYDESVTGVPRHEVIDALAGRGLKVGGPRTMPLHRKSVFAGHPAACAADVTRRTGGRRYVYGPADLPTAERLAATWLGLPADYLHSGCSPLADLYAEVFGAVWKEQL
ncbi:DegT/DnrJ/EryC1/StrS family aminotransferase [Streptomyces sp. Agncl-13]|uniref:DegT/DnrJ/EryC1/StrS family aminotransferase n=1 Tax=Streptomyces sp. Agncl-13 TaxID=3400628 RepID=UPI003A85E7F0